jgi:nitrilase
MYDVARDDLTYRESDETQAWEKIWLFELDDIKMGVGICVDLRYPEYFRRLIQWGAEIIFLPSNFRKLTGQIARDILTKARAIEDQVYFCACGQTGGTGAKERCGNSRIISFDGKIISEIGEEEGMVSADIDLDLLRKFRKEFPVLRQIR